MRFGGEKGQRSEKDIWWRNGKIDPVGPILFAYNEFQHFTCRIPLVGIKE